MGLYAVLSPKVRVDLGVMFMKRYRTLLKVLRLEVDHQILKCQIQETCLGWGSYSSSEMESMYSTAPADWTVAIWVPSTGYIDRFQICLKYPELH